jgi:hypothetical protein
MSSTGYACTTQADVALAAATAKSILGVLAPASFGVSLRGFQVSFNGTTASATPALVELCTATFVTNGPGTNSTSGTVRQESGRAIAAGFTTAYAWSTEPTALVVVENFLITPNGGSLLYDYPLEREPDNDVSVGFVLRVTAPAIVTGVRATMKFGRC